MSQWITEVGAMIIVISKDNSISDTVLGKLLQTFAMIADCWGNISDEEIKFHESVFCLRTLFDLKDNCSPKWCIFAQLPVLATAGERMKPRLIFVASGSAVRQTAITFHVTCASKVGRRKKWIFTEIIFLIGCEFQCGFSTLFGWTR